MSVMTQRRVRHVPVKDVDAIVGIINIGDVLKHRLGEMKLFQPPTPERQYIAGETHLYLGANIS